MDFRSFFLFPLEQRNRFVLLVKVRTVGLFVAFRWLFMTKEFLALEHCYNASVISRILILSVVGQLSHLLGWSLMVFTQSREGT